MKELLIKIAEYIEALEARLAAQEAQIIELSKRVTELEERPVVSEPQPVVAPIPEPVIEPVIERIVEPVAEPVVEPVVEPEVPQTPEPPKAPEVPKAPEAPKAAPSAGSPVDDLRQAISLGDRFLFQRELFGQNGELMQKTIDALNKMPNLDGAIAYIDKHFDWNQESTAYELFLNALRRRFS